ncbi:uncharacterized protein BCR38DRAFT_453594 [Pseudomassariella vexata]|uniref:Uncharacterized protein n=1 Tax=Pseudomassariella vexata TaxID=1141098 RepID=A0A1Y2EI23_9PEZI|nr:uncharacterized protein BCR38DRAFT_453594 [Pseudomassariella vexata]ORY70896.1 hypothetical protein BCR38DRAFT_453594 [Pseudomassariella vexata]
MENIPDVPSPNGFFDERKAQSAPDAINKPNSGNQRPPTSPASPLSSPVQTRATIDVLRTPPKTNPRPSIEFDRRYDGPFGRPSVAMARRPSLPPLRGLVNDAETDAIQLAYVGREVGPFQPLPPSLNYTLRTRKMAIFLFWTIIVFDSVAMPVALYFGLWYGVGPGNPNNEKLSANTVFSIVTAAIGGASIVEYFVRFWRLYRKESTCVVLGAHRWYLDSFHWNFSFAWIVVMIELIIGSVPDDPLIRLLSMPLTTMLFVFGTLLLIIDTFRYFRVPAPVRISSVPRGAQLRPGIYSLIEDICAVDGSGGTEFREALERRYEASHVFRAMLRRLGEFWAFGAEGCAVLCTILIFGLNSVDAAYVIGWSVPFVWAGIWTLCTFWYVNRELKKEAGLWAAEANKARV